MWKMVLAGATALAIAGGTFAYAQHAPDQRAPRWRPNAQDIGALTDARIAALHAGLRLNAEQEKNWPAVESAIRDLAKEREQRLAERGNAARPSDPIERLARRADRMQERGAALKKLADAAAPLYRSLDEAQKHRFVMLARALEPRGRHFGERHRYPRGWRAGPFGSERGAAQDRSATDEGSAL